MYILKSTTTDNVAIAKTITPSGAFALESVMLHLSAAGGAGNLTITVDSGDGAAYDTVLFTQDMTLVVDLYWQPERPIELDDGDQLLIAWANGAGRTYGLIVKWLGR